jgi:hypothetical protein
LLGVPSCTGRASLSIVFDILQLKDIYMYMHKEIIFTEAFLIYFRFLATGDSFQTIAFSYRMGHATVQQIVKETTLVLWKTLCNEYMPPPNMNTWRNIENEFFEKWNYPNCVGAIDGKHIVMQCPSSSGSLYYNYKGTFSIVLMAVVDANYKFVLIDVGGYGRNSDGGVLSNSKFGKALTCGQLNIPPAKPLPFSKSAVSIPHVIVGDEAFPLKTYMMRPYAGRGLNDRKTIFNYRLSRARRCSENAFGILVQRWRIFRRPIIAAPHFLERYVKACCILHNFLMKTSHEKYSTLEQEIMPSRWLLDLRLSESHNSTHNAQCIRDEFAEYFQSEEGGVSWQLSHVQRGLHD